MDSKEIMQKLLGALSEHQELWEWIEKLDSGTGTYEEVGKIAEVIGDKIALNVAPEYTAELLDSYAAAGHELISLAGEAAQTNLNQAAGIGIKPMTTHYPKAKVQKLNESLALLDADLLPGEISNSVPSLMLEMVDDIVQYNADFQAKAGLKPVIVRTWSGSYPSNDTKHTDWCKRLAGTYDYGSEPKEVYARHKGCRCKVEYFPNRTAMGRITALSKGEIDLNGVLWNTRADTLAKRLRKK